MVMLSGQDSSLAPVGIHCILELYECPAHLLDDEDLIRATLHEAAQQAQSTLLGEVTHRFHPQGVTALALLAESHISIHTWPELGYAAADVFTCGTHTTPVAACDHIVFALQSGRHVLSQIARHSPTMSLQPRDPSAMETVGAALSRGR